MIDDRYVLSPTFNDIYWVEDKSKLLQCSLFYCTDRHNAEIAVNYLNSQEKHLVEEMEANKHLKFFQRVVFQVLEDHINHYEKLDDEEGLVLGDVVHERLTALKDLRNVIHMNYGDELSKDLPKAPIRNCRCIAVPLNKCDDHDLDC